MRDGEAEEDVKAEVQGGSESAEEREIAARSEAAGSDEKAKERERNESEKVEDGKAEGEKGVSGKQSDEPEDENGETSLGGALDRLRQRSAAYDTPKDRDALLARLRERAAEL